MKEQIRGKKKEKGNMRVAEVSGKYYNEKNERKKRKKKTIEVVLSAPVHVAPTTKPFRATVTFSM